MTKTILGLAKRIDGITARLRVLATSVVSLLMLVAVVAQSFADQVGADWPQGALVSAKAGAVILAAIFAIRRVTPVAKEDRGMLS